MNSASYYTISRKKVIRLAARFPLPASSRANAVNPPAIARSGASKGRMRSPPRSSGPSASLSLKAMNGSSPEVRDVLDDAAVITFVAEDQ